MTRRPFQGLILDFAGVLATGIREAIDGWSRAEGLPPDAWRHTLDEHPEGRADYLALEAGLMTQHEWNRRTAARLGLADPHNLMGRAWAGVRPAHDMIALARAARAAGLRVAMLSNSFGLDPYDPYAHVGVWDLFDVTVISEREGLAKPDPAIYRLALDRVGLPGTACVFVDDRPENLPPATALGITTLHADGHPETTRRLARLIGVTSDTVLPAE
ncbi:HAD-IA family hydrolase [Streptomyces hainanensis]|uniref:HAD family hydrolase n=1 Tax=Streptomyces hainanensis TaxID=402648 RepID=A0A4R4SZX1_9ACTN|nr:HAD-IA family hydrolase [Streptomyces hainanensis]TDC70011.1 HAD family hydrolase [Streptomyces hainanensis]